MANERSQIDLAHWAFRLSQVVHSLFVAAGYLSTSRSLLPTTSFATQYRGRDLRHAEDILCGVVSGCAAYTLTGK